MKIHQVTTIAVEEDLSTYDVTYWYVETRMGNIVMVASMNKCSLTKIIPGSWDIKYDFQRQFEIPPDVPKENRETELSSWTKSHQVKEIEDVPLEVIIDGLKHGQGLPNELYPIVKERADFILQATYSVRSS
ncbi:MAG: hypothetical protein ABIH25_03205 [Candidatus Woesearchaeota archaeon]